MKKINKDLTIIVLLLLTSLPASRTYCQSKSNSRTEWFTNDRFGMFIHFGLYSGAEGVWKGEKLRNDNDYAEWIQYRNRIEKNEYLSLVNNFDWSKVNPEEWVIMAKNAGMKYVTITAKHHDGFALWDSKSNSYNIASYTNPKRDIVKELAAACKKHGLKLGLYYSHWVDWEHEYGWDHTKELTGISPENYNKYWQEKVIPQMRELLTGYGPVGMIWFDMWIHHSETVVTKDQLVQLKSLIRELQPGCLINSRLGLSVEEDPDVDFQELGDNEFGVTKKDFPWQSPATVAHSWGYNKLDYHYKSTTQLLHSLIRNVSLNGNMLLNIGPGPDGSVPPEIEKRLAEMGEWLKINGESIYGSGAYDLPVNYNDWGVITCNKRNDKTMIYLHLFNTPFNRILNVTGIASAPEVIYLLDDPKKTPVRFNHDKALISIQLPEVSDNSMIPVLAMEFSEYPAHIDNLVAKNMENGYSMNPENLASKSGEYLSVSGQREGTVPEHVLVKSPIKFKWTIFVDKPGRKRFDISYSYQGGSDLNKVEIITKEGSLDHRITNTGKTVGEPRSNWIIDNFRSSALGELNFSKSGYYDVEMILTPAAGDEVKFQWLWIK
jgi:alpha-L-fucosidase